MVSTLPNFNQSEKGIALGLTCTLGDISRPSFDDDSQGNETISILTHILDLITVNVVV